MHKVPHFSIEEMTPDHSEWQELVDVITQENQAGWAFNPHFEQFTRYFLVAKQEGKIVGFLMFVPMTAIIHLFSWTEKRCEKQKLLHLV